MTKGVMRLVVVAVLIGLGGAFLLRQYMLVPEKPPEMPPEMVTVPLASLDLPVNRVVKFGDIAMHQIPANEARDRGLVTNSTMMSSRQIIGRRMRVALKQGRPFVTTEMYPEGDAPGVIANLREGFRAVQIALSAQQAGAVAGDSHVDVSFRTKPRPAGNGYPAIEETTVPLLSGINVLAADRGTGGAGNVAVTLEVTSEQARKLQTVEGHGDMWLTVLKPGEVSLVAEGGGSTLMDILGIKPLPPEPERVAAVLPRPWVTEVWRRGAPSANAFSQDRLVASQKFADSTSQPTLADNVSPPEVGAAGSPRVEQPNATPNTLPGKSALKTQGGTGLGTGGNTQPGNAPALGQEIGPGIANPEAGSGPAVIQRGKGAGK